MNAPARRWALAALLLAGCRFDLSRNPATDRGTSPEASPPRDLSGEHAHRDRSPADSPKVPGDGSSDGKPISDAKPVSDSKSNIESKPSDAHKGDTTPKVDANLPKPDGPPPAACAGATTLTYWTAAAGKMLAVCEGYPTKQCGAASFCNQASGWSICPASVYKLLYPEGSASIPAAVEGGWIGGCVYQGKNQLPPADGVCASCACTGSSSYTVGTQCAVPLASTQVVCEDVGLRADKDCWTVGSTLMKARWIPIGAATTSPRVLCCK